MKSGKIARWRGCIDCVIRLILKILNFFSALHRGKKTIHDVDLLMRLYTKHKILDTKNPGALRKAWNLLVDEYNHGISVDGTPGTFTKTQLFDKIKNYKKTLRDSKSAAVKSFKRTGILKLLPFLIFQYFFFHRIFIVIFVTII